MMTIHTERGDLALRVLTSPHDLNAHGTVFGGAMLSYFDIAGAAYAMEKTRSKVVLASVKNSSFLKPTYKDEMITFYATTQKVGRSSITVKLEAWRSNPSDGGLEDDLAASAEMVYVAINDKMRPHRIKKSD